MPRRSREDVPGGWFHVINRAIARRPMFEDTQDVRYFLSSIAREVHRGEIELHAYAVMTTHYHALIRSVTGRLSAAMQRMGQRNSRGFNRRHRRDGTLVRGRFFSKRVRSLNYRRILVRYIDTNPVRAGLAKHPWDYPFGSAAKFVHGRIPPWLETSWIESEVTRPPSLYDDDASLPFNAANYIKRFGGLGGEHAADIVARRISYGGGGPDDLDSLIEAAPARVLAWMQRKAKLADGGKIGEPLVVLAAVDASLMQWPSSIDQMIKGARGVPLNSSLIARVGLLRSMVGMTWAEMSRITNLPESTCRRHFQRHTRLLLHEPEYALAAAAMASMAIELTHGL